MSYNVGVNVVEVEGRATPSIQPAEVSVAGFSVLSERGVPDVPVEVTNWTQFVERFGGFVTKANGAYALRGFFANGGTRAFVTRVVNTEEGNGVPASLVSATEPWSVEGVELPQLTFETEATSIEVELKEAVPAELRAGWPDQVGPVGKELTLTVNAEPQRYQFVADDFPEPEGVTAEGVAAVLNRRFRGVKAWVEVEEGGPKTLVIQTDAAGRVAALGATGEAAVELGLPAEGVTGDGDIGELSAVTLEEALAILGETLAPAGLVVSEAGGGVKVEHPEIGDEHTLAVSGSAAEAFQCVSSPSSGTAAAPARAASKQFNGFELGAGWRGVDDPGAWGNGVEIEITENAEDAALIDLAVRYGSASESWERLAIDSGSERSVDRVINDPMTGSKYVRVVPPVTGRRLTTGFEAFHGGEDGTFSPGTSAAAFAASFARFETVDIQLLCCPELHDPVVVTAGCTHAASKGDRMFVGHTPGGHDFEATTLWMKQNEASLRGDKVYGALYFPWVRVLDPLDGYRWVPPTGHILGVYARTALERGVWKAPAGNAARLRGVLESEFSVTDTQHTVLVKERGINAVRSLPGLGTVVDSSRTLSSNPLWLYISVRLLFNFVKSSLKSGLRWVVQEPNDDTLWNKVKYNSVTPFLTGLWRRGAFGPGSPEEVFSVKIDAENNPPANIQQGIFTAEVYFYPSRPAETIVIIVGQQEGAASAAEA